MLKVVLISKWHVHARDYARELSSTPGCEIAGVWDEDAAVCKACLLYTSCLPLAMPPQPMMPIRSLLDMEKTSRFFEYRIAQTGGL